MKRAERSEKAQDQDRATKRPRPLSTARRLLRQCHHLVMSALSVPVWAGHVAAPRVIPCRRLTNGPRMSRSEIALFIRPWYHNFASLGIKTSQPRNHLRPNQLCKQTAIFELIQRAVKICRQDANRAEGVELFCADGFYANYALQIGATRMVGIDLNKHHVAKAHLITKLLGQTDRATFVCQDVFALEGSHDFAICAGGLYHISDPRRLLQLLRAHTKKALVLQTVYSLVDEADDYFETPAPGQTWGCRFSYGFFLRLLRETGWHIAESWVNELKGNDRPQDRGSAFALCLPERTDQVTGTEHRHDTDKTLIQVR